MSSGFSGKADVGRWFQRWFGGPFMAWLCLAGDAPGPRGGGGAGGGDGRGGGQLLGPRGAGRWEET